MVIDTDYLRRATTALCLELPEEVARDYVPRVRALITAYEADHAEVEALRAEVQRLHSNGFVGG